MERIMLLFSNQYLITSIIAWFIAQLIKVITTLVKYKKIDFRKFISSGGMPSSHSSCVTSIATTIGEVNGYDSIMFAFSVIVALIVMYDAAGVRRAAGKQARVLNQIVKELETNDLKFDVRLKELLGHTPIEVFAGAILGIVIALIRN